MKEDLKPTTKIEEAKEAINSLTADQWQELHDKLVASEGYGRKKHRNLELMLNIIGIENLSVTKKTFGELTRQGRQMTNNVIFDLATNQENGFSNSLEMFRKIYPQ